ncbi:hypothetical protein C8R45DRAFT_1177590 [Mycena sanguinolenta]|nr:hypothetical protein C8R45DRAFT_1177590 [Mycena sanguinolenta]
MTPSWDAAAKQSNHRDLIEIAALRLKADWKITKQSDELADSFHCSKPPKFFLPTRRELPQYRRHLTDGGRREGPSPRAGLVYTNVFAASGGNNGIRPHQRLGSLRTRQDLRPVPQALCHHYDRLGCEYNAPRNVDANTFEYCLDNDMMPVRTFKHQRISSPPRPTRSTTTTTASPYTPKPALTSSCTQFASAADGVGMTHTVAAGNEDLPVRSRRLWHRRKATGAATTAGSVGGRAAGAGAGAAGKGRAVGWAWREIEADKGMGGTESAAYTHALAVVIPALHTSRVLRSAPSSKQSKFVNPAGNSLARKTNIGVQRTTKRGVVHIDMDMAIAVIQALRSCRGWSLRTLTESHAKSRSSDDIRARAHSFPKMHRLSLVRSIQGGGSEEISADGDGAGGYHTAIPLMIDIRDKEIHQRFVQSARGYEVQKRRLEFRHPTRYDEARQGRRRQTKKNDKVQAMYLMEPMGWSEGGEERHDSEEEEVDMIRPNPRARRGDL